MESSKRTTNKDALVLRLERNQREAGQLRNKLNSYICEPRTYSLFERIESLKNSLEVFNRTNAEILFSLKERKKTMEDHMEKAKKQFMEFHKLQRGVEEYMRGVRSSGLQF